MKTLKMNRPYGNNQAGDVCGYPDDVAAQLCDGRKPIATEMSKGDLDKWRKEREARRKGVVTKAEAPAEG